MCIVFFSGYPKLSEHVVDGLRCATEHLRQLVREHVRLFLYGLSELVLVYLAPPHLPGLRFVIPALQPCLPLVVCLRGYAERLFQFPKSVSFFFVFDGLASYVHTVRHIFLSAVCFHLFKLIYYNIQRTGATRNGGGARVRLPLLGRLTRPKNRTAPVLPKSTPRRATQSPELMPVTFRPSPWG